MKKKKGRVVNWRRVETCHRRDDMTSYFNATISFKIVPVTCGWDVDAGINWNLDWAITQEGTHSHWNISEMEIQGYKLFFLDPRLQNYCVLHVRILIMYIQLKIKKDNIHLSRMQFGAGRFRFWKGIGDGGDLRKESSADLPSNSVTRALHGETGSKT